MILGLSFSVSRLDRQKIGNMWSEIEDMIEGDHDRVLMAHIVEDLMDIAYNHGYEDGYG